MLTFGEMAQIFIKRASEENLCFLERKPYD